MERRGWFADQATDEDVMDPCLVGMWFGVLQLDGMVAALDGPWFDTEEACDRWLRQEVIGRGMWADD